MIHAAGDSPNTMRPPVVATKGTTVFTSNRPSKYGLAWGNYNTTCLGPTDPTDLLDVPGIRNQQGGLAIHDRLGRVYVEVTAVVRIRFIHNTAREPAGRRTARC